MRGRRRAQTVPHTAGNQGAVALAGPRQPGPSVSSPTVGANPTFNISRKDKYLRDSLTEY